MSAKIAKGTILIAPTSLNDPSFEQSVVLICDHGETGTYGLILNRPVRIMEELSKALPFRVKRLCLGGPVQPEALQVLHPYGDTIPGGLRLFPDLWLGGDFEIMSRLFAGGELAVDRCRFFLGYAGWDAGQLDGELAMGAWLVVDENRDLLELDAEIMWSYAVREYGKRTPLYANFPTDPSWN